LSAKSTVDQTRRIAPKESCGYWTVRDWQIAMAVKDWPARIQIFKDRMEYRYFGALQALVDTDQLQPTRRYGFSIMALDCLLIETLHQFYKGYKESKGNGVSIIGLVRKITDRGSNGQFFCEFLMKSSSKFRPYFDSQPGAAIIFYQDIRCGILHSGETQKATLIRIHKPGENKEELYRMIGNEDGIILYRDVFQCLLNKEFTEYCKVLEDGDQKELRRCFVKKMGYICGFDYGDGELE
jgi:hypothetical protein